MAACAHLDAIQIADVPGAVPGCEECLATGSPWCHLRLCLTCGHVGCCDSSPGRHATKHAAALGHPLVRSIQPGEDWAWCYVDQIAMPSPVPGATNIPPSPLCP
jgi:uncharacterized UBP type Zn finger protein